MKAKDMGQRFRGERHQKFECQQTLLDLDDFVDRLLN